MNKLIILSCLIAHLVLSGCQPNYPVSVANKQEPACWQTVLQEKLPLLGHRNWIVITDMAYPLQAKEGITTLYAGEPYTEVLKTVKTMLDGSKHVYAHTYQDKELSFLEEDLCPGITDLKTEMDSILTSSAVEKVNHDQLIARLDSVSNMFEVVIIKTGLTMPYTSTFFELDCKYWNNDKQSALNKRL